MSTTKLRVIDNLGMSLVGLVNTLSSVHHASQGMVTGRGDDPEESSQEHYVYNKETKLKENEEQKMAASGVILNPALLEGAGVATKKTIGKKVFGKIGKGKG